MWAPTDHQELVILDQVNLLFRFLTNDQLNNLLQIWNVYDDVKQEHLPIYVLKQLNK